MRDGSRPHRHTRHRTDVSALLQDTTKFRSAQCVHALLRQRDVPIGLTTVYRILQTLADEGAVDAIRSANGEQVYRRCRPGHHHHLMCRSCGQAIEVEGPAIEEWATAVAADHGFRDVNHSIEFFGTCRLCATAGPAGHTGG